MLQFIIKDVLRTSAILVGLFSLIGLLLQKKPVSDVISGTLKTIMGFVILITGANLIAATRPSSASYSSTRSIFRAWCRIPMRWPRWHRKTTVPKPR